MPPASAVSFLASIPFLGSADFVGLLRCCTLVVGCYDQLEAVPFAIFLLESSWLLLQHVSQRCPSMQGCRLDIPPEKSHMDE